MNLSVLSEIFTTDLAETSFYHNNVLALSEALNIEPVSIDKMFAPCKIKRSSSNMIEKVINFRSCFYRYLYVNAVTSSNKPKEGVEKLYTFIFVPALALDTLCLITLQGLKLIFAPIYVHAILVNALSKIVFERKKIMSVIFETLHNTIAHPILVISLNTAKLCEILAKITFFNNLAQVPEDNNFLDGTMFTPWDKFKDFNSGEEFIHFNEEKYRLIWEKSLDKNSSILQKLPDPLGICFVKHNRTIYFVHRWAEDRYYLLFNYIEKKNSPI